MFASPSSLCKIEVSPVKKVPQMKLLYHQPSTPSIHHHHGIIAIIRPMISSSPYPPRPSEKSSTLSQSHASKGWENEAGLVDIRAVVSAKLLLLLDGPATDWILEVTLGVLAANHEANLARWVGWDGGVGVFDVGENLFAVFLELGDHSKVEPLVLSYSSVLVNPFLWEYCKQ